MGITDPELLERILRLPADELLAAYRSAEPRVTAEAFAAAMPGTAADLEATLVPYEVPQMPDFVPAGWA